MRFIGISPSRRNFLRRSIRLLPAAAVAPTSSVAAAPSPPGYKPTYFTPDEWDTLTALVDRLIPHDQEGPGALEAGVAEFIDRQMATPYAYGKLWYMDGPFLTVSPEFGYQLPLNPRAIYRQGLADFANAVRKQMGKHFSALTDTQKDGLVAALEKGTLQLDSIPAQVFFGQVLQNTREGYFCDPKYGGNKDMAAWRMIGFPGARADYMDWVEQYGKKYPFPPVSSA
jgi:gluconate 2-dehydrogenase gamma chain